MIKQAMQRVLLWPVAKELFVTVESQTILLYPACVCDHICASQSQNTSDRFLLSHSPAQLQRALLQKACKDVGPGPLAPVQVERELTSCMLPILMHQAEAHGHMSISQRLLCHAGACISSVKVPLHWRKHYLTCMLNILLLGYIEHSFC